MWFSLTVWHDVRLGNFPLWDHSVLFYTIIGSLSWKWTCLRNTVGTVENRSCYIGDGNKGMKKEGSRAHKTSVTHLTQHPRPQKHPGRFCWVFSGVWCIGMTDMEYYFSSRAVNEGFSLLELKEISHHAMFLEFAKPNFRLWWTSYFLIS